MIQSKMSTKKSFTQKLRLSQQELCEIVREYVDLKYGNGPDFEITLHASPHIHRPTFIECFREVVEFDRIDTPDEGE